MAGEFPTIIVAQAQSGDALQQGVIVSEASSALPPVATTEHASTEEHAEVFPPFDPSTFTSQLVWLAIAFAVLYLAMSRMALPRIGGIIEARKTRIEGDLKEAERLRAETDKAVAAYETALSEARQNAHKIAQETRESIRADLEAKRKTVEDQLAGRVAEADVRINQSKTAALANVDSIATETVQALVTQLTGAVSEAEAAAAVAEVKGTV
jgi:F-type H+-transporting ATPase subunit b